MLCIFNSSFSSRVELSCGTIYSKKFSFLSPTYTLARGVEMCFAVHIYLLKFMHRVIIGGGFFEPYKIRLFSRGRVNSCTIRSFHDSFFFLITGDGISSRLHEEHTTRISRPHRPHLGLSFYKSWSMQVENFFFHKI